MLIRIKLTQKPRTSPTQPTPELCTSTSTPACSRTQNQAGESSCGRDRQVFVHLEFCSFLVERFWIGGLVPATSVCTVSSWWIQGRAYYWYYSNNWHYLVKLSCNTDSVYNYNWIIGWWHPGILPLFCHILQILLSRYFESCSVSRNC